MTPTPAFPGRCPLCRQPLRQPGQPAALLHTDLDRAEGDPGRTVHADCRRARAAKATSR